MSLPTVAKSWLYGPNVRLTYTTLNGVMSNMLYNAKNFAVATAGYTVKYTCDGTTGPTSAGDHTDRWASAANCTTRGATGAAAQSFLVLTDANGCDMLFAYQGSTDDIAYIAFSPGGLYAPAGTSTHAPTATDEIVIVSTTTIIDTTTSTDRVLWLWASADKKMFRAAVFRQSVMISFFGVEQVVSAVAAPATFSPAVVGFFYNVNNIGSFSSILPVTNAHVEQGKAHTSVDVVPQCGLMFEQYNAQNSAHPWGVEKPELQGSNGEMLLPIGIASTTTNANGKLGVKIDIWFAYTNATTTPAVGDTFGSLQFVVLNNVFVLPWDGVSSPAVA